MKSTILSILVVAVLFSCKKDEPTLKTSYLDLPAVPANYGVGTNNYVPELGRVLFYDKQLSINNSVSCSSCHKQVYGFADNVALSRGFDNQLTVRNSMPIQNLGVSSFEPNNSNNDPVFISGSALFWDGREHNLNNMVLRPIINHVEMGISEIENLAEKLSKVDYYKPLFNKAFGAEQVTPQKISTALTSFVKSINSTHTKFDMSIIGQSQLSGLEEIGKKLFISTYNCNTCHQVQSPNGYQTMGGGFSNIGLDKEYQDNGLAKTTGRSTDEGRFKIPSLRNVAFTGPYMHDGRFSSLEEVMEHYSTGIEDHPNLDFRLRDSMGQAEQKNISEADKKAIIAFLNTLSDFNVVTAPKFSSPFKTK
jgi:cytochrome c peroxidase